MQGYTQFYIDGEWVSPAEQNPFDVINPATEETFARISLRSSIDVDRAVGAARRAFDSWSATSREERLDLFSKIKDVFKRRAADVGQAISMEMGAPISFASTAQAGSGIGHLMAAMRVLKDYRFHDDMGATRVVREPIGVVGMITPWNWPINQLACKVAPAMAAGCTMVLKPSEIAPISACIFAEILDEAGVPPGVFNLVQGDGPTVGAYLSSHPDVDMMSFTGSTRAGVEVALNAAPTIKRVSQELGGKSANIILDDADFERAVSGGVINCFANTGQSCNAPSRMLVPADRHDEAVAIAERTAEKVARGLGDPSDKDTRIGPVVSAVQFDRIQGLIAKGIDEGATLVAGGTGRPEGFEKGYFVKPTVFANVSNEMTIAREEIFGPVLCVIPYQDEDDAVRIANDTPYGLSGYVSSGNLERAQRVASRLRSGMVHLNGTPTDVNAPFGGYKQSGNGREWGAHGFEDFLEVKSIMGWTPDAE